MRDHKDCYAAISSRCKPRWVKGCPSSVITAPEHDPDPSQHVSPEPIDNPNSSHHEAEAICDSQFNGTSMPITGIIIKRRSFRTWCHLTIFPCSFDNRYPYPTPFVLPVQCVPLLVWLRTPEGDVGKKGLLPCLRILSEGKGGEMGRGEGSGALFLLYTATPLHIEPSLQYTPTPHSRIGAPTRIFFC